MNEELDRNLSFFIKIYGYSFLFYHPFLALQWVLPKTRSNAIGDMVEINEIDSDNPWVCKKTKLSKFLGFVITSYSSGNIFFGFKTYYEIGEVWEDARGIRLLFSRHIQGSKY